MVHVSEWGPRAWAVLHTFSRAWKDNPTPEDRRAMHAFLKSFGPALPCPKCAHHFGGCVARDLPTPNCKVLTSRETLEQWLIDVHNDVNRRLGKREYRGGETTAVLVVALLGIIVLCLCVALWRRRV